MVKRIQLILVKGNLIILDKKEKISKTILKSGIMIKVQALSCLITSLKEAIFVIF